MIKIKDIVINNKSVSDVVVNSVGIIKAINDKSAMVLFVGVNKILNVDFANLKTINHEHTGKGYDKKICNICHILKPTDEFDVNQTDAKGRKTTRPSCRICRKDIDGVSLLTKEKMKMDKIKPEKGSIFECPICQKTTIPESRKTISSEIVNNKDSIMTCCGVGRKTIYIAFLFAIHTKTSYIYSYAPKPRT